MSRSLLLQSILGHMDLLAERYPKKAASPVARRAKRYVTLSLNGAASPAAGAAATSGAAARSVAASAPERPLRRAA